MRRRLAPEDRASIDNLVEGIRRKREVPHFTRYKIDGGRQELRAINCLAIKEDLKLRGFRWDPGRSVWWKRLERGNEKTFFDWIKRNGWTLTDGGRAPFGLGG